MIDPDTGNTFQNTLRTYYRRHGRHDLPWRVPEVDGSFDPYKIMVSEYMLQQTQVSRVIPKYREFLERFPDLRSLAAAEPGEVLRAWSGLGYNRRALALWRAAGIMIRSNGGKVPDSRDALTELPGIGPNTAGAVLAYAYNLPAIFIETNLRTVFLHHFFQGRIDVEDKEIVPLVQETLNTDDPRRWYWAVMDYGSHLKQTIDNPNRRSKHYTKQSRFEGSARQVRGRIISELRRGPRGQAELSKAIRDERFPLIVKELLKEGMIRKDRQRLTL